MKSCLKILYKNHHDQTSNVDRKIHLIIQGKVALYLWRPVQNVVTEQVLNRLV
jgi:hypothetical protein